MNYGSVNFAETMPYLHAMNWYDMDGGGHDKLKQLGMIDVHIITDSQVIARWGTTAAGNEELPWKHVGFWAGIRELRRLGYRFTFHWAPRCDSLLNWAADLIAGLARREMMKVFNDANMEALAIRAAYAIERVQFADPVTGEPISPYHLNHDQE
jgi:hypothetical protein